MKTLKKEKRMMQLHLVDIIYYEAYKLFNTHKDNVNKILQQLLREKVYLSTDENDALYVVYLP